MVRKGLIAAGAGLAAVFCSIPLGVGPCGPATIPSAILFYGGMPTFFIGCGMVVVGLVANLIRRIRRPHESNPSS
jgi:hypothetical protein